MITFVFGAITIPTSVHAQKILEGVTIESRFQKLHPYSRDYEFNFVMKGSRIQSVFLSVAKWKNRVGGVTQIDVCWENPNSIFKNKMGLVKTSIASTWQSSAALNFRGWGKCESSSKGIRIKIEDSGPKVKNLGSLLDGVRNGMILNFTFKKWNPSCQDQADMCTKIIAIHEFGHALGFAHEQNRHDAPGECRELRQGVNGDRMLTSYDPNSVMNYCSEKYNNGLLSKKDIIGLISIYGPPIK